MRFWLAFLLATSTALARQVKRAPASECLILTNVNVVDTRHGRILPSVTVVVKDGLIAAVAKIGLSGGAQNTRIINAGGKYLIPGLWDMDAHSASGAGEPWDENTILPLYIANGITGIRDMGGDEVLLEQRRKRINSGQLLGPHMVIAGPFLNGGASNQQTIGVNTPDEARQAVDSLKRRGVDFIAIASNISPAVYWPLAEAARSQHLRLSGEVPAGVSALEASLMGQGSIENLSGVLLASSSKESELRRQILEAVSQKSPGAYSQALAEALDTYDPGKAWNLFAQFVDNGTWQVPTLGWDLAANADNPGLAQDASMKYMSASTAKRWNSARLLLVSGPEHLAQMPKLATHYMRTVDLMRRAGVLMMAGTGAPDRCLLPGFSLHDEFELLVKAGLSTTQALQAATFNPALFLTKLDRYGVVEPGHAADLVLLEDDPLKDIRNTRKISAVILSGHYFAREDLDKMLQQVEEIARRE